MRLIPLLFVTIFFSANLSGQVEILNEGKQSLNFNSADFSHTTYSRSDVNTALDEVFDIITSNSTISGFNAAVSLPDGSHWTRATGWAKDTLERMRTDHHMGMGSITKTFVAATIMRMEEEGLLSINDHIGKYIRPTPNIDTTVTIAQLLNHTTGFNDYLNENPNTLAIWSENMDSIWHMDTILTYFVNTPNFQPGQRWSYSNTNYLLAGKVIESITGQPWYLATRSYIIDPLNLEYTYAAPWENKYEDLLAHPFADLNGDGMVTDATPFIPTMDGFFSLGSSAGNLVTTPSELSTAIKAIYDGSLLTEESISKMQVDYLNDPNIELSYGLGTMSFELGLENYGHNGSIIYQSTALYFPELDITIACQQNDPRIGFGNIDINVLLANLLNTYLNCLETSSVTDQISQNFIVAPNPADQFINIQLDEKYPGTKPGQIRTLSGQLVRSFEIIAEDIDLDISTLGQGLYFIQIGNQVVKFIKF